MSETNGYGCPRQTGTSVRDKRVRVSETNGYGHTTNLEWASDKTGTDHTTAVGSCRECWRIPANDTYVEVKPNESAYKGVKLSIPILLNNERFPCSFSCNDNKQAFCALRSLNKPSWKRWRHKPRWMNTLKRTQQAAHTNTRKAKSNMLITPRTYRTIHTFWYWFGALRKQAYFGYRHTDDVNWYGRRATMQTGVRQVRVQAYRWNGNGRMYRRPRETLLWHVP